MGNCNSCKSTTCSAKNRDANENDQEFMERRLLASRMCEIKYKIFVLSGKGGVGKSTVSANIAVALARSGKRVGILDVDIHGPSIPKMLGVEDCNVKPGKEEGSIIPVRVSENLVAMSVGFLTSGHEPIIWRGPMKYGVIKQFLKDVEWGVLDYLIIDLPPGTGDEPLTIAQIIENPTGVLIVTTPQQVAISDVKRSVNFCRKLDVPILGVIENMSGFVCPSCGEVTNIFKKGGAEDMCEEMQLPFAGRIPLNGKIVEAGDSGSITQGDSQVNPLFDHIVNVLDFSS